MYESYNVRSGAVAISSHPGLEARIKSRGNAYPTCYPACFLFPACDCRVTLMSLAADHLVANIVHESSLYRNLRLQRPGEQGREDAELGGEEGQMLTNEDLSLR